MRFDEFRSAERFLTEPPLHGVVGTVDVTICDVAKQGIRVEHAEPLIPLHSCNLTFTLPHSGRNLTVSGLVAWSGLFRDEGEYVYRSGIHVDASSLETVVKDLVKAGVARPDSEPVGAKATPGASRAATRPKLMKPAAAGLGPDQIVTVHEAAERLLESPAEMRRWSQIGRSSLGRGFEIQGGSHSQSADLAVAVWESLGHSIELRAIANALGRNDS